MMSKFLKLALSAIVLFVIAKIFVLFNRPIACNGIEMPDFLTMESSMILKKNV